VAEQVAVAVPVGHTLSHLFAVVTGDCGHTVMFAEYACATGKPTHGLPVLYDPAGSPEAGMVCEDPGVHISGVVDPAP